MITALIIPLRRGLSSYLFCLKKEDFQWVLILSNEKITSFFLYKLKHLLKAILFPALQYFAPIKFSMFSEDSLTVSLSVPHCKHCSVKCLLRANSKTHRRVLLFSFAFYCCYFELLSTFLRLWLNWSSFFPAGLYALCRASVRTQDN